MVDESGVGLSWLGWVGALRRPKSLHKALTYTTFFAVVRGNTIQLDFFHQTRSGGGGGRVTKGEGVEVG